MKLRRALYASHRWIGLAVSVQLLLWSLGGFIFSVLKIDDVHGDRERKHPPALTIVAQEVRVTVPEAMEKARGQALGEVVRIELRPRLDRLAYLLFDADGTALGTVDAANGDVHTLLTVEEARAAAIADFAPDAPIRSIDLFTKDPPLELRGKPLPAYRIVFEHPKEPHIFVSAVTGDVVARRNRPWRLFDFFYMLHVMDYREREDFNHLLLTVMSALAVLTAATGLALHASRFLRRRPRAGTPV